MLLIRWILVAFRLGYVPKIGADYYYSLSGPFSEPIITPIAVCDGWVKYSVQSHDYTSVSDTSFSTFAIMCIERKKDNHEPT